MATNVFITTKAPDIVGGSSAKGHEGWIEVLSWNHGWNQPTTPTRGHGGGGTLEKVNHQNFVFTKILDSATDDLLKMIWTGKHIDNLTMVCYRSAGDVGTAQMGVPYLKVELESVIVTDYQISGSIGDMPMESVAVNYSKVTYTYNGQDKLKGTAGADQPVSHCLASNVVA